MDTPLRTRLQLTAILAAAVLILTAAVPPLSLGWVNDTRAQRQIDETQVRALRETQSLLVDAETGQRGFVITGTDAFLDVYRQATTQLPGTLDRLSVAYSGAPAQERALVDGIVHAARAKMDELARTVALRRSHARAMQVEPA